MQWRGIASEARLFVGVPELLAPLAWYKEEEGEVRSTMVQASGIWWVTLISRGFSLRVTCEVSASSVSGITRREANELVEDEG